MLNLQSPKTISSFTRQPPFQLDIESFLPPGKGLRRDVLSKVCFTFFSLKCGFLVFVGKMTLKFMVAKNCHGL